VTVVYTDGACLGNPGPGGWGWAVPGGRFATGCETPSTNQRMEIAAVLDALRSLPGPVEVVSDSTYVVNCFRDRWWAGWQTRGWLNKAKKPVANRDLWEPLIDLYRARGGEEAITFRWVKGHSGDPMNDLVDRLAVEAAETQAPRSGDEPPTTLGPADRPGRSPGATAAAGAGSPAPALTGHPLAIFGHRPPALGGWSETPLQVALRDHLREILAAKAAMHADLRVVSGMALGTETIGAETALDLDLPLTVVLPYPEADSVWPDATRARFAAVVDRADQVVTLDKRRPKSRQQAGAALSKRDAWVARQAVEAVLVWDGVDEQLRSLHRSLEDHLGDDVWVVDPNQLAVAPEGRARP
jgi:ribonuclease HI